jgi:uncharacterized protein YlxW (UPF0749 family)
MGDESDTALPQESALESSKAETELDLTGRNVLSLLQQASDLAGGNTLYAVEIAQKLSEQLWSAQKNVAELQARVTELEAEVQLYRDKSERAELWLSKISSEIQQRVLGDPN